MTATASWMTVIHHNAVNAFHDALNDHLTFEGGGDFEKKFHARLF
jgi:hypothetical protein